MPVDYIPLNIGIDFGSDYLTNEVAYFLGGILAANEQKKGDEENDHDQTWKHDL